jgi:hypothetical protein
MATILTLAVSGDTPPRFPTICVGCGAAPVVTSSLGLAKLVAGRRGSQRPVKLTWPVPHCAACARSTKAVFLAQLLPFALGFLAVGGAALAAGWYGAVSLGLDEIGTTNPRTPNSLVLAGAAGLAGGIAGGFVMELVARVLLLPAFGRALWAAPLLVPSIFTDADYVAGLGGRLCADGTQVTLTFAHDAVADAFAAANGHRTAEPAGPPAAT